MTEVRSAVDSLVVRIRELGYRCELNQGCSKERLDWLGRKIGVVIPDSLSELLQYADGESFESEGFAAFGFEIRLLDTSAIDSFVQIIKDAQAFFGEVELETTGPVKSTYWNSKWIPFLASTHVGYFVDMDPAQGGTLGQVIRAEVEEGLLSVESTSIKEFLMDFASGEKVLWPRADA